jgi:hypothetical protein
MSGVDLFPLPNVMPTVYLKKELYDAIVRIRRLLDNGVISFASLETTNVNRLNETHSFVTGAHCQ